MNASLRDLGTRAGAVPAPQLDVASLVAAGQSRIRRRRFAAVAAVTAAVLVVVVGGALIVSPGTRHTAPPPAGPDRKNHGTVTVQTRLLTYSVGTAIHWGDRTIDVVQQAQGRKIGYVDATDDGAVFVIDHALVHDQAGWGLPYGPVAVWFTDGSAPVRIGTTSGSSVRGFGIAPSAEGSSLAWTDPGTESQPGQMVVYDTAQMKEVARFGGADAEPLAVYDDVVYWTPDGGSCMAFTWESAYGCERTGRVMRFDPVSGRQSLVSMADYEADRRARPGLLTGASDVPQVRRGVMFLSFVRHGDRLVAVGREPGVVFTPTVALSGQPLRLRLPASDRNLRDAILTQWLDADRVVLVATDSHDRTNLLVCRLSTGGCGVAVRGDLLAPGPAVSHG